jgi:sugar phosphate isomerase/epimerase
MGGCPFGINAGEFPHWPIARICDLALSLQAQFVELSAARMRDEGLEQIGGQVRDRGLAIHINCASSELRLGFSAARAVHAPIIVVFDDAVERPDRSRRGSLHEFRTLARELLEHPGHDQIRVAMENAVLRMTRLPEDLLAVVEAVDHPRCGINYDPDNYFNAGVEGFPYAYEIVKGRIIHMHAKDSTRYLPQVHGEHKRVLHRAGGNMVCVPVGTGAVNWAGLADRLKQDGYTGPISLEPHNLPEEMASGMEQDAAYLRRVGLVQ